MDRKTEQTQGGSNLESEELVDLFSFQGQNSYECVAMALDMVLIIRARWILAAMKTYLKVERADGEKAQQVKARATKPDNLRLISGPNVTGEN